MNDVGLRHILDDFFKRSIEDAAEISQHYAALWQEMYRLIGSGGKRLRPKMTILAYQSFGGADVDSILPAAASQELLHLSMLIHDDIIDRDYVRYGVPNIEAAYLKRYNHLVSQDGDRRHYAQSAALLGGDLLISASYQLLSASTVPAAQIIAAQHVMSHSIFEVAGGELLDTESVFRKLGDISAETVARYKTASYSFVGPLLIGALLADATHDQQSELRHVAENLGIAYQLADDLIGTFGSQAAAGKPIIGDIREGKRTYLVEQFYRLASTDQKAKFETVFGRADIVHEDLETARDLLVSTGALDHTETAIADFAARACASLDRLQLAAQWDEQFRQLVSSATARNK